MADSVGAVLLLRKKDGAALLQHRDEKPGLRRAGMWVFPGGHCDCEEPLKDCADREMFEETNYRCENLRHLMTFQDDAGDGQPYPLAIFWDIYDDKQELKCLEGQNLQFIRREDANLYRIPVNLIEPWDQGIRLWQTEQNLGSSQ